MNDKPNGYIRASIAELKKVQWPTKKEAMRYTILVIAISLGIAVFIGVIDFIFNKVLEFFIS